jgi:peptidylprolyl isomerase
MRARALALSAAAVATLLTLASCGTGADTGSQASSTSQSTESTASSEAAATTDTAAAPEEPADTEVASPVDPSEMPTATGDFGDKPTITLPSTPAPDSLQRIILSEGDGPASKAGDTVIVNYLGQVWGGDVFDNSYDRGAPFSAQIGGPQRQVVVGWDIGLQGVSAGSRVLLSFPARDGYGSEGSGSTIPGGASLIFVVDVISVYPVNAAAQADAAPQNIPTGWPAVGGELGELPTLTIPATLPEPAQAGATLVAKGTGHEAVEGQVLAQYYATSWDGTHTEQSWPDPTGADPTAGSGPQALPLNSTSPFAALLGMPVGSRVLLRTPADPNSGVPSVAWVIDLIDQINVTPGS